MSFRWDITKAVAESNKGRCYWFAGDEPRPEIAFH